MVRTPATHPYQCVGCGARYVSDGGLTRHRRNEPQCHTRPTRQPALSQAFLTQHAHQLVQQPAVQQPTQQPAVQHPAVQQPAIQQPSILQQLEMAANEGNEQAHIDPEEALLNHIRELGMQLEAAIAQTPTNDQDIQARWANMQMVRDILATWLDELDQQGHGKENEGRNE
ncbi:hypothetical protein P7C71_g6396, partial [Lecanoromycetidae sp. Uapishka_2]